MSNDDSSCFSRHLSVIIPALNEESNIQRAIQSVRVPAYGNEKQPEIIVIDGGSRDNTVDVAKQEKVQVLQSKKGRGIQMDTGWRSSNRPYILFMHADAQLPPNYLAALSSSICWQPPGGTSTSTTSTSHTAQCPEAQQIPDNTSGASQQEDTFPTCKRRRWWHIGCFGNNRHASSRHTDAPNESSQSHHAPAEHLPGGFNSNAHVKEQKSILSAADAGSRSVSSSAQSKGTSCCFGQTRQKCGQGKSKPEWAVFRTIVTDYENPWQSKFLSNSVAFRTRFFGLPYGDQGLLVSRRLLEQVGGIPHVPLLEDVEMVSKLRRATGTGPAIIPLDMHVSGRRWENLGFLRTTILNQVILAAWAAGVPPTTLAQWYYNAKSKT